MLTAQARHSYFLNHKGSAGKLRSMSNLDLGLVRHALQVARDHGFAEVEIEYEESAFAASLDPTPVQRKPASTAKPATSKVAIAEEPGFKTVKSSLVGYFQAGKRPLSVGDRLAKAEVIGSISALGIANDVESSVAGEILEVLVTDGQPVMFGQILVKVKP